MTPQTPHEMLKSLAVKWSDRWSEQSIIQALTPLADRCEAAEKVVDAFRPTTLIHGNTNKNCSCLVCSTLRDYDRVRGATP